jgi:hypothetical protein
MARRGGVFAPFEVASMALRGGEEAPARLNGAVVDLAADCSRCFVVPAFSRSAEFAIDKPGGTPCPNLALDHGCTIHDRLRPSGFAGCTTFDCLGAGQQVAQVTFGGRDWRTHPHEREEMYAVFPVMRQLHELLWYVDHGLSPAVGLAAAEPAYERLRFAERRLLDLVAADADTLTGLDVDRVRAEVNPVLREASALARTGLPGVVLDGAELLGRDLRADDLRGASFRGALLIGADLRGVDLDRADVTGADLRGANLAGADLTTTLFLTPVQLASARGDESTRLPERLARPTHWTS